MANNPANALKPIDRVSPTRAEDLLMCRFRALRGGNLSQRAPRSPSLALGLASHAVAAQVYRGAFDDIPAELTEQAIRESFDAQILYQRQEMEDASIIGAVPEPRRWKNHNPTRRRLPRFLTQEVQRRRDDCGPRVLLVEEQITSRDGVIFGFPDRVENEDGTLRVVDLKTGVASPHGMPAPYRRQLLMYAYLWHEQYGQWPDEGAIQRADGRMDIIAVDRAEALDLIGQVRTRRDQANQAISAMDEPSTIAEPSPDACQRCRRRPYCHAFKESLDEMWDTPHVDVIGIVSEAIEAEAGSLALDIAIACSNLPKGLSTARVIHVPQSFAVAPGEGVAVLDAARTSRDGVLRIQPWSTIARR